MVHRQGAGEHIARPCWSNIEESRVFFGDWCDAMGFVRIEVRRDQSPPSDFVLQEVVSATLDHEFGEVSTFPAFGNALFIEKGLELKCPRLYLKGDAGTVPDITDNVLLVMYIAGDIEEVRKATSDVVRVTEPYGNYVTAIGSFGMTGSETVSNSGFKDPVSNLQELSKQQRDAVIFTRSGNMGRGTFIVHRVYYEDLELWVDLPLDVQEQIIGRRRDSSELLGGGRLWPPHRLDSSPINSHVRCVRHDHARVGTKFDWQDRMYRRGFSYLENSGGEVRYGLHFIALCRSPESQVKRIHDKYMHGGHQTKDNLLRSGYIHPLLQSVVYAPCNVSEFLREIN